MKLEVGKQYLRIDGKYTGPMRISPLNHDKFWDGVWQYDPSGKLTGLGWERPASLVEAAPATIACDAAPTHASGHQVGGSHYKDFAIQPAEFVHKNRLGFLEGNVIKYVCRYKDKGGREDLEKARHYIDLLIQYQYPKQP